MAIMAQEREVRPLHAQHPQLQPRPARGTNGRGLEPTKLESIILDLYAIGKTRRQVARLLLDYLAVPNGESGVRHRMRVATRKLRSIESTRWFRDLLWERAVVNADLKMPVILDGLTRKAAEGKVDAAKLTMAITGRHTEQGETQATQVNIVFGNNLARPGRHQEMKAIESQQAAEENIEEGEWTES